MEDFLKCGVSTTLTCKHPPLKCVTSLSLSGVHMRHDLLGGLVPLYRKRKDSGRRLVIVSWGAHGALSFPTFFAYIRCSSLFSFDHSSTLFGWKRKEVLSLSLDWFLGPFLHALLLISVSLKGPETTLFGEHD